MSVLRYLQELFLLRERRCALCLAPYVPQEDAPFCPACLDALLHQPRGWCPRCGQRMQAEGAHVCGRCLQWPPPWQDFFMLGLYEQALREALVRGKFRADSAVLQALGRLLGRKVRDAGAAHPDGSYDAVVPMPLHPARLRQRGFNQCQELARPLSALLGVPIREGLLTRVVDTAHQMGLSAKARRRNLRGAFSAGEVEGLRILLLDDVLTTGTTLRKASAALAAAGAFVGVAVVARA